MTDEAQKLIDQAVSLKAASLTPEQEQRREAINARNKGIQANIKGMFFAVKKKGE